MTTWQLREALVESSAFHSALTGETTNGDLALCRAASRLSQEHLWDMVVATSELQQRPKPARHAAEPATIGPEHTGLRLAVWCSRYQ